MVILACCFVIGEVGILSGAGGGRREKGGKYKMTRCWSRTLPGFEPVLSMAANYNSALNWRMRGSNQEWWGFTDKRIQNILLYQTNI